METPAKGGLERTNSRLRFRPEAVRLLERCPLTHRFTSRARRRISISICRPASLGLVSLPRQFAPGNLRLALGHNYSVFDIQVGLKLPSLSHVARHRHIYVRTSKLSTASALRCTGTPRSRPGFRAARHLNQHPLSPRRILSMFSLQKW